METLTASAFTVIHTVFELAPVVLGRGGYLSVDKIKRFPPKTRRNDHIKKGDYSLVEETAVFLGQCSNTKYQLDLTSLFRQ